MNRPATSVVGALSNSFSADSGRQLNSMLSGLQVPFAVLDNWHRVAQGFCKSLGSVLARLSSVTCYHEPTREARGGST